ncbi:MAG: hypothetical protein ACHQUC_05470 [Chlamydiales bacterium]
MFKKIMLLGAMFCSFVGNSQGLNIEQLPNEFSINAHWFSLTTSFSIEAENLKIGTVHRRFFSTSLYQYDFYDIHDHLNASGRMRWLSFFATFDVTDVNDQLIGRVENKFAWFFPTFHIISPEEVIQAVASLNIWETTYTVTDPISKKTIATMHRSFFRLKDDWKVEIINRELFLEKKIDPRLFVIVMVFQSDLDAETDWDESDWDAETDWDEVEQMNSYQPVLAVGGIEETCNKGSKNLKTEIKIQRTNLQKYSGILNTVEPHEDDFESVDLFVTAKMEEENQPAEIMADKSTILRREFEMLLPLFEGDELSLAQKSALFIMLDHHLNSIK